MQAYLGGLGLHKEGATHCHVHLMRRRSAQCQARIVHQDVDVACFLWQIAEHIGHCIDVTDVLLQEDDLDLCSNHKRERPRARRTMAVIRGDVSVHTWLGMAPRQMTLRQQWSRHRAL
jgi:hypothetical protein